MTRGSSVSFNYESTRTPMVEMSVSRYPFLASLYINETRNSISLIEHRLQKNNKLSKLADIHHVNVALPYYFKIALNLNLSKVLL